MYNYSDLSIRINGGIKGKIGMLINSRATINSVVRQVVSDIDLRSTRRKETLNPDIDGDVFIYDCPSDMKGYKIISILPPIGDGTNPVRDWRLIPFVEFNQRREVNTIAISDSEMNRKILAKVYTSSDEEDHEVFYYTKYGWKDTDGVYKPNSTINTDILNADDDEFELFVEKGIEVAGGEVDEFDAADRAFERYNQKSQAYVRENPSEALDIISTYADFED